MAITYKTVELSDITGTNQAIYTCPADTQAVIVSCIISNRNGITTYDILSMSFTSVSGAPTGYYYFHDYTVAPNTTKVLPECEGQLIEAGKIWEVSAGATGSGTGGATELTIRATIKEIS